MTNFVQIQTGNSRALVRPENLAKVEDKLAKVKPPVMDYGKITVRDRARVFPAYKPGMSTAEYVRQFERANGKTGLDYVLNENPAAQYDATVPLCVEDSNPDYVPGLDDAPVKPKRTRKAVKPAPDKSAVMWLLMDHGLTMYQAGPLADKLLALFGGE
jgi:hypothetical protein